MQKLWRKTVTILNASLINIIAHSEGFGINTDILETNVLNLAVVIGVLVYYGKPLFLTRKRSTKNILSTNTKLNEP